MSRTSAGGFDELRRPRSRRGGSRSASRRRRSIVGWTVTAAVVLVLGCLLWIGVRGALAINELQSARSLISTVQAQVEDRDFDAAGATAERLAEHLDDARALTGDPVWRVGEVIPFAGPNLSAVRVTSQSLAELGEGVIRPVLSTAMTLRAAYDESPDGTFPVEALADAVPTFATAREASAKASAQMDEIDTSAVVAPLADAVEEVRPVLTSAAGALESADTVAQVVPSLLGANGPRTQLTLILNNAELRSAGGIVGALAEIRADQGGISLGRQSSASAMTDYDVPVLPLSDATLSIYSDRAGRFMQNVTAVPDFATTGQLASEMWSREFGVRPDGVIALDPVALGYILEATGPVTLATGDELRADNAAQLLMQEMYARYADPEEQDAFFASVTAQVFGRLAAGDADPVKLVQALSRAEGEQRLRLWSSHEEEQELISRTDLAAVPPVAAAAEESFEVYLNDRNAGKMDYYLDVGTAVRQQECTANGLPIYEVEVTVTSTAPADAASALSDYVLGDPDYGVERGRVRTDIAVYASPGAVFLDASRAGEPFTPGTTLDGENYVATYRTDVAPGESVATVLRFVGSVPPPGDVSVGKTPTVTKNSVEALTTSCGDPVS